MNERSQAYIQMSSDGLLDHCHVDRTSVKTFSAPVSTTKAGEAHIPAQGMKPVFATRSSRLLRPSVAATRTLSHRYASISKWRELGKSGRVVHRLLRVKSVGGCTDCRRREAHTHRGAAWGSQAVDDGRWGADWWRQLNWATGHRVRAELRLGRAVWRLDRGRWD